MKTFRWVIALVIARIPAATWTLNPLADVLSDAGAVEIVKDRLQQWRYASGTGIGMVFFGPNGTGKTTLACEIAKYALSLGQRAGYTTANEIVLAGLPGSTSSWLQEWIQSLEVVVVDELDKPYAREGSSYVASRMDAFLRQSIIDGQLLIAATNDVISDLAQKYGQSFVSALERSCTFVTVDGPDLSRGVQERHSAALSVGLDYYHPQFQRWAQLYHTNTYRETEEIL